MFKKSIYLSIILFAAILTPVKAADLPYKEGELLIRFAPKTNGVQRTTDERNQILSSFNAGTVKKSVRLVPGLSVVKLPDNLKVADALAKLGGKSEILYVEPNYKIKLASTFPDDTRFDELWGMHNTGQTGGTADADIDAPEAWDIITDSNVIVAVLDTGIDYTHPDLAANMWINEAELNGTPGVDDDDPCNGYIDDVYGWDFADDDNNPTDYLGHGTHCAGTIGASGNNDLGVTGVCWNVRIMNLKIFPNYGEETFISGAIDAIEYAVYNGATILSNSWRGYNYSQSLKDAIDISDANGILFVAAAGNEGYNNDSSPSYPASYDCNNIISVMATNHTNEVAYYSNYGPTSVDIGAPGGETNYSEDEGILSTIPGNGYDFYQGTSMATPHVAGACALVWAANPQLTYLEVKDYILQGADKLGSLEGLCVSEGRLNLYNALTYKPPLFYLEKVDVNEPNCVIPDDYITYRITYGPNGVDHNNVVITDFLPFEVHFVSAGDPNDPNAGTYHPSSHTVTWEIDDLGANDPCDSVTLTVKVNDCIPGCGTITNFCEAESDSTYNTAEANTPVCSASSPEPTCTCGAIVVDVGEFNLTWCPGLFAADVNGHEVYFGSNFNDVNDANNLWPIGGVYKGQVTDPCYSLRFNTLDLHTIYYWRIDEVNDPDVWRGGVWSFTTGNYFVVDDFDSYANHEAIKAVWNDYWVNGSRADVYLETSIAHDGNSMRYIYYNSYAPYYAEAYADVCDLPSQIGSDWTAGASALVLYFYGQSDNDANEQMYVRLHDADSNAVVTYGDYGDDPNDLRLEQWQEWNIDLNDFNSAGVDLTNVTRITIGFGDGVAPDGDGEGTVYFDDIRLYIYCLSRQASEYYDDWLAWGKPNCWCYARQCRGDINGILSGPFWVNILDLGLLKAAYGKFDDELPEDGICADLNHKKSGPYRVNILDLDILKTYYGKFEEDVNSCDQSPIITGPYNFWTTPEQQQRQSGQTGGGKSATEPVDIEALIEWLEELWLTDEQLRQQFSKAEWLEFIETVRETPIY